MENANTVKVKRWESFKHNVKFAEWNPTRNIITWLGLKFLAFARACFKYTKQRCARCGKVPGMGHIRDGGHYCDTCSKIKDGSII